eukprot:1225282-Rhodomonas_salina.1
MFPRTYSFYYPSCCPTHPSPQALYYLTSGEFLRHRDSTLGESSALTQTVNLARFRRDLSSLFLLYWHYLLAQGAQRGRKGEREDEDSSGTEREDQD